MDTFPPNARIGGYCVIRLLGRGGMGAVYEVVHEKLGVHYALKTFTLGHGHVELLKECFLAEGRILARLHHPRLVRVFDLDVDAATQTIYFVMDLVLYKDGEPYRAEEGRFRCYLATLVRNELVSRWRRAQARVACVPLDGVPEDALPPLSPEAAALLDAKWRLARHEAAVEHALTKTALARQSREIYRAYALEGRPIDDVAAAFGVSRNTVAQVKTRVNRMVASLEAEYGE